VCPVRFELGFYIPEDDVLHSHRRENLKFYKNTQDCKENELLISRGNLTLFIQIDIVNDRETTVDKSGAVPIVIAPKTCGALLCVSLSPSTIIIFFCTERNIFIGAQTWCLYLVQYL
jgi:hypothetical protein